MRPSNATNGAGLPTQRSRLLAMVSDYVGMLVVLMILIISFSSQNPRFFAWTTLTSIVNQIPALTVVSVGMTLVLITGEIDLSVGSVLALSGSVIGVLMADHQWSLWTAICAAIVTGAGFGLMNGLITVGTGVPSFIVSLGILQIARGAAYLVTESQIKFVGVAVESLAKRLSMVAVSPAFLLSLAIVGIAQFVLTKTVFGRYCIATGTNEAAVRMCGIDSRPVRVGVFVICGAFAALAGAIETSRISAADPNGANGFELSAIAAAVIGGTSLMGGRGSVINTFFGVLMIAILQTGLSQLGVDDGSKKIVTGTVIVLAVVLDASRGWVRSKAIRVFNAANEKKRSEA